MGVDGGDGAIGAPKREGGAGEMFELGGVLADLGAGAPEGKGEVMAVGLLRPSRKDFSRNIVKLGFNSVEMSKDKTKVQQKECISRESNAGLIECCGWQR